MQPATVGARVRPALGAVVATDDLFRTSFVIIDQKPQIPRRLMHVQTQRMRGCDSRHFCLTPTIYQ